MNGPAVGSATTTRRRLLLAAGLSVAAPAAACTTAQRTGPDRVTVPTPSPIVSAPAFRMRPGVPQAVPGTAILGAYLDLHGLSQAQSVALRRRQLGRDLRVIHWFYEWYDALPATYRGAPRGTVVMLSWRAPRYGSVLNGSQDNRIAASARNLARYGRPIFLRFAWEMNGDWYEWGGPRNGNKPANFVAVWRRIHKIFQAEGATNVGWVWSPNHHSNPQSSWNDLPHYYPGDAYVDWVGVSGYSTAARTPDQLFDHVYQLYADRKPLIITESGVREKGGRQSADWVDALGRWFASHPSACGLVWFDTDTHKRGTADFTNFRVDRDPLLLAAYRRLATAPRFAG